jgi:hypothetical protein
MKTLNAATLGTLILLGGCKSWAELGEMQVEIEAPDRVSRFGNLIFRIRTMDARGLPLGDVHYQYAVDWPGVKGMVHRGISYKSESLSAKGPPGTAVLRIFTVDANGNFVEGLKKEIQVY